MPLDPGFLQQIVNVQWEVVEGLHFLYSGADGMFGSEDGEEWKKLKEGAVPATGLAWVDDVWLAIGSGGPWRSEDGGKTWTSAPGPEFEQIAACATKAKGIFAGYKQNEEGSHEEVYISRDLGKSWVKELNIPTEIPFGDNEDGFEFAQVLSGCGNGIFLSTVKGDTRFSNGDGCVYVAMDGGSFGGRQQIWSGTTHFFGDPDPHTLAYSAGAVGFDSKTRRFCLMYYKDEGFGPGGALGSLQEYSIGYATGSGGSFSGETEIIKHIKPPLVDSYSQVVGGLAAAGGDGKFAATYEDRLIPAPTELRGDLVVTFFEGGSGATPLISVPNMFGETASAQIGPVCWKPSSESESTETPTGTGTFACLAFGVDAEEGGVWIEKGDGGWHQTHSGQGLIQQTRAGLAVGKLSWLDSDNGA